MELPPLTNGRILSRYKRFLADVELENGEIVTAHCPNTGAMTGCWQPGAPVQLSESTNPKRKLRWTLERVDMGAGWIGVNTSRVNHFIADFIDNKTIVPLTDYTRIKNEPVYLAEGFEKSRFDLLLQNGNGQQCYVEVKNTTLFKDEFIQFPDAVTTRGRKHLELLEHAVQQQYRGIILFAVNRPEGKIFKVAADVDPLYQQSLQQAYEKGVEILVLRIEHTDTGVEAGEILPFIIDTQV